MNRDPVAPTANGSTSPAATGALPPEFARFAQLARAIAGARRASVMLTGSGECWCGDGSEPSPDFSAADDPFFVHALRSAGAFEVIDASRDARFRGAGDREPAVRGYAGWPLRTAAGEVLGVLAIYDSGPIQLTDPQRALIATLAEQCVAASELRARIAELELAQTARPARPSSVAAFADKLLESMPVAIYYADPVTDLDWCNAEYRRMFGLRPEQSSKEWAQGVHPDDLVRIQETWDDFCRRPRPMRFEYRAVQDDGGARFFAEKVVPTVGLDGYVGSISDFTDLVHTRGELHKVEALFRNTFDQAPIGIAFAGRNGKFQRFNRAFCAMLGYSEAELAGRFMDELTPDEDVAECATRLERLWDGEVPFLDFEKRYRCKNGSYIWVRATTTLVLVGERAESCVEFLRDITQRKALTTELAQQRNLLETVIGDLPVALIACDRTGTITHYNRAAVEMHCIQLDETGVGAPTTVDIYHMDGVTPLADDERPLARALRGEHVANLELTIVPDDATPRTTLSSARRLLGPDGETLGAVAVVQDTTERKYQEIELERVNKELITASREAGMAEVATNVLHNVGNILNSVNISASLVAERVRQSRAVGVTRLAELLQQQGERLGEFLTNDARGKRIPEYLTALGEQLLADQRAALEELGLLRDNIEHIKDTVTMQQSYAKRCGVTETVEVADLVEDSLRLNAGAFARHGVTLKREFAQVPRINVDKHKVLQILVNLVRNAKYACDDSGRADKLITLRIEELAQGVRISVIDNGIGIPPENMSRMFQHGFTTRESGHGFGLHSGALAAQELGGALLAQSAGVGLGASFMLELPLNAPKARA
jgi:PAS domain S-box-containing protein